MIKVVDLHKKFGEVEVLRGINDYVDKFNDIIKI